MLNRESQHTVVSQQNMNNPLIQRQRQELIQIVDAPQVPQQKRLIALDVYRGLTMVGMIMVDNMGPHPPWYLDHAEWNGLTPADLIFPSFLFIMGMAIPLAVTQRNPLKPKNIIRIFALFAIGVFLNLSARKFTFDHFRILGILQRLSVCYAVVLAIHVLTRYGNPKRRVLGYVSFVAMILIYLAYMLNFTKPEIGCTAQNNLTPFCNFGAYIDRMIFTQFHMIYPNDPQGLFTNLGAIITTYFGYSFCLIMKDNKEKLKKTMIMWLVASLILGVIVYPLTNLMPLNKKLYSISFAILTSASSGLTLLFFVLAVDIVPEKYPSFKNIIEIITRPLLWLGRNPLAVFVMMDAVAIVMIKYITIDGKSLWAQFYHYAFADWITDKQLCSTIYACFFLLVWTIFAAILYKFKIFVKL